MLCVAEAYTSWIFMICKISWFYNLSWVFLSINTMTKITRCSSLERLWRNSYQEIFKIAALMKSIFVVLVLSCTIKNRPRNGPPIKSCCFKRKHEKVHKTINSLKRQKLTTKFKFEIISISPLTRSTQSNNSAAIIRLFNHHLQSFVKNLILLLRKLITWLKKFKNCN